ncbi:GNAT family N-acetyltransferase [Roseivivax sp. CAU 1753]
MRITVRRAGRLDFRQMAALLNEITRAGGTTAITREVTAEALYGWMDRHGDACAWHLAEDETGAILGFQYIAPNPDLPPGACTIATFTRAGQTGLGIGSALFEASKKAARALGFAWIDATIRAENEGGLIYYQSRGFEEYGRIEGQRLANGAVVDKRLQRYDL